MEVRKAYRLLLRSISRNFDSSHRCHMQQYARDVFSSDEVRSQVGDRLRIATELAHHLDAVSRHRDVLLRYNITSNRDAAQREHVETIANRVGLQVPRDPTWDSVR
jgi:hypothetical protein